MGIPLNFIVEIPSQVNERLFFTLFIQYKQKICGYSRNDTNDFFGTKKFFTLTHKVKRVILQLKEGGLRN